METTLTLLVKSRSSAVSARIAITLMKLGFRIDGQQYATLDDGAQARLKLRISGEAADHAKLFAAISDLPDVVAIEGFDADAELVNEEDIDRQVLSAVSLLLIAEYPDILTPLRDFESGLTADLRPPLLFSLGEQVGAGVYRERFAASGDRGADSHDALNGPLARTLKPFAAISAGTNQFSLPHCPLAADPVSENGAGCSYLTGFSKGVLCALPKAESVKVTKISCRARGDEICRFEALSTAAVRGR